MTKLTLVPQSKSVEEETTEIQLPLFDIFPNYDDNWFTETVEELEDIIKQEEAARSTKH